jgi:YD repeat-containing protein
MLVCHYTNNKTIGYHEETHWTTTSTRNSDGELVEERQPTTRRIDDFNFDVDVSSEVSDVCQGVYILPDPKSGEVKSLRELCNEYVHERNILKELQLTKEVNWDYNGLTRGNHI